MTISSLTNVGVATNDTNAASSSSASQLAQNFDTFLTLLTTQLKNQDPTSPMESDKFTDQLSQFAQVEQGIQSNKNLENLLAMQSQQRQLSALSYVGAEIEAVGDTNWLEEGGDLKFKYNISPEVPRLQIQVQDQSGKTVYSEDLTEVSGLQDFTWDGKNNSGVQQATGAYTMVLKPMGANGDVFKDENGDYASAAIGIIGNVDSVDIDDDDIYLRIGDVSVPFATLTNVKLGANSTDTGSETDTGDDASDEQDAAA
ncbi:flagellar hook assembly protein FlgD [Thalassospira alkalitolerans]|uniref:Basal-body rod modification protein FlgD n=1 Tax=Thalassospira alkalitolerans TaxID=1293890 RepID=A0A1Y2L784_9PROT|nr:flagellar hook capping FlgD N-terminal domain-containing protein [Thalassospira alkalitolerans]OSQ43742.1 flagellar basal body rod modification protein FlgD [Thalassospira alkalitolerans]|tara:strand:- start:29397 stop:30167 length:771 start_codon:yes stop_codon:yes gene_type:complete